MCIIHFKIYLLLLVVDMLTEWLPGYGPNETSSNNIPIAHPWDAFNAVSPLLPSLHTGWLGTLDVEALIGIRFSVNNILLLFVTASRSPLYYISSVWSDYTMVEFSGFFMLVSWSNTYFIFILYESWYSRGPILVPLL